MDIFDAHFHLEKDDKKQAKYGLCCAASASNWQAVLALAMREKNIIPCFGIHPWYAEQFNPSLERKLIKLLEQPKSCMGEIGLDGLYKNFEVQYQVFIAQLLIAKQMKKPVILHCVKAWGKLMDALKQYKPPSFIIHSYAGSAEITKVLVELGGYFSFGASIQKANSKKARQALGFAPKNRILFESENGDITEVVKSAAKTLNIKFEEAISLANNNAESFLKMNKNEA